MSGLKLNKVSVLSNGNIFTPFFLNAAQLPMTQKLAGWVKNLKRQEAKS